MEQKDIEAIYSLMQNLDDNLSSISRKIDHSNSTINPTVFSNLEQGQMQILKRLNHQKTEVLQATTKNYNYMVFGKDMKFNTRLLMIFFSVIFLLFVTVKFLIPSLLKTEELERQNEKYLMLYDYIFLKNKSEPFIKVPIEKLKRQIEANDEILLKDYNTQAEKHQKELKRRQLELELKKLK